MNVLCTLPMDPAGLVLLEGHATVSVVPDQRPATLYALAVDEEFLKAHPVIEGPAYV